jgi:hypothetical protein
MALGATAMIVTIVQLLRLREPPPHALHLSWDHRAVVETDSGEAAVADPRRPPKAWTAERMAMAPRLAWPDTLQDAVRA